MKVVLGELLKVKNLFPLNDSKESSRASRLSEGLVRAT